MQLAHYLLAFLCDQNRRMNGPKVGEVICKMFKPTSSDATFHNIVIKGRDIIFQPILLSTLLSCVVRC
jgi:hypothetical protein